MIIFRKIKWKNFLSTGNYFTELQLDKESNTLVVGQNGSGKSTMLDALCFALFGKPFRAVNKPQLINSINGKDCVVEVEFDTGNKSYRIVRGIKPNIFEIYCNGELINQDAAVRDYQEYLEKFIVKLNFKSFTQIVILGSASFVPFMQLSNSDRRAIIEDLLDIQIFSAMNSLVRDRLSGNKDALVDNKSSIDLVNRTYTLQEKHINELKVNNESKILEYEQEIANNQSQIVTINTQIQTLNTEIDGLQKEIVDKAEVESKIKKITKLESQIETNITKYKKDIQFFEAHDDCPTCRQAIASEFKTEQVATLGTKVTECDHGLKQLETKLTAEQTRLVDIQNKLKEIQALQVKVATNTTTVTEINKYIRKLQIQIEGLTNTKENLKTETAKLVLLKEELEGHESKRKELIDEKSYYEAASVLLKDTGIKTKIIKQYLPVINKLVNKHLATLDFFVNFNLDESFKETIKSRHRDEFSYASFSEGEKQRIDMALMLTWRAVAKLKNSANTNLLILDEVFDSSLDTNGTEYLMNILQMLENVNLFVISHKGDILQDKFRSVIRFEKVKNFSRIIK
jgi:DNA repair exonuclease SbcCD ATPase subunit